MEDNVKLIETLLEKAIDYARTSYELVKLRTLDKTAGFISSFVPNSIFFTLIATFLIFLNLGLSFWLGDMLGKIYYGFFIVAAFYGLAGIVIYLFFRKQIKTIVSDYIVKRVLK